MLELTGTCYAVGMIEKYLCKRAVERGIAKRIKDTSVYDKQDDGFKTGHVQNKFHVVVYHNYLVNIKAKTFEDMLFQSWVSRVRVWYDDRKDRAGIKITLEDLIAILKTFDVIGYLHDLNIKLGGGSDGNMDLNKLADMMTKAAKVFDDKSALSINIKDD